MNSQGLQCREVRKQSIGQGGQTISPEAPDDHKIRTIDRPWAYSSRTNGYCVSSVRTRNRQVSASGPAWKERQSSGTNKNTDTRYHNVATFTATARRCHTVFCILCGARRPRGSRYHRRRVQVSIQALRPSLSPVDMSLTSHKGVLWTVVITHIRPLAMGFQRY